MELFIMFSLIIVIIAFLLVTSLAIFGLALSEQSYNSKQPTLNNNNHQNIQLDKNTYNKNENKATTIYNFADLNNSVMILSLALVIIFLFIKSNKIFSFISIYKNKIKTKNILTKFNYSKENNLLNLIEEAEIQILINNLILEKINNPEISALNLTLKNKINYLIENKFNFINPAS